MLDSLRGAMAKYPWIGWIVALLILAVAVWIYMRRSGASDTYSVESMTEMVTIKYTDTGEEVQMPRGRFEILLRDRQGLIDKTTGVINPATGAATGFLYNKSEWERTVDRLNNEKINAAKATGGPMPVMPEKPKEEVAPAEGEAKK